jgi:hypothetical protein
VSERDERIENYYQQSAWDLAERIVDLEDGMKLLKEQSKGLTSALIDQELDPSRLESALRMYVAELDYDIHKGIECHEEDGLDRYPEEVEFFLRCWETAGEG